jgi:uncharacterized membrane protein YphA (DoxX/SURF4 family)
VVLGVIFIFGGIKIAFPADPAALAASYINPTNGWISPFFATLIQETLGFSVSTFLKIQGLMEIGLGVMMVMGLFTPVVAIVMGLMFWSFTIANPVLGEIRLSRDIALMGLCFVVAFAGASAWSMDAQIRGLNFKFLERKDALLLFIRLSVAFPLLASAVFSGGVLNNPLNTTLPNPLVFLLGVLLAAGVFPRWILAFVFLWLLYPLAGSLMSKGIFWGLEGVKREVGFLAAAFVYFMSGPDRWSWPKPGRQRSRDDMASGSLGNDSNGVGSPSRATSGFAGVKNE